MAQQILMTVYGGCCECKCPHVYASKTTDKDWDEMYRLNFIGWVFVFFLLFSFWWHVWNGNGSCSYNSYYNVLNEHVIGRLRSPGSNNIIILRLVSFHSFLVSFRSTSLIHFRFDDYQNNDLMNYGKMWDSISRRYFFSNRFDLSSFTHFVFKLN